MFAIIIQGKSFRPKSLVSVKHIHTHTQLTENEGKVFHLHQFRTGKQQPASYIAWENFVRNRSPQPAPLRDQELNAETPWNDTKLVIGRAVRAIRKNINEDGKILWIIFAALKFPASESSKTTTTLFSDWIKSCAGAGKLSDRKLLATEQTRFRWFSYE